MGLSLAQLFGLVETDDEFAFDELHLQTKNQLRAVAQNVLRSPDLVEDVVQESYLQI